VLISNLIIDKIPAGDNPPEDVNVIIEVLVGGEPIKYELNKDSNALFVDRFLYTPMRYPGNYGFVPHILFVNYAKASNTRAQLRIPL